MSACSIVIGLGKVGLLYDLDGLGSIKLDQCMTHCKALATSKNYHLCAVYDADLKREQLAKSIYKVFNCNFGEYHLAVFSTPTESHLDSIRQFLKYSKSRVILVEKPAGSSSSECETIESLCIEHNIIVYVNYFRRFLSGSLEAHNYFHLIRPSKLIAVSIKAYGELENIFSHFIDLSLWVTHENQLCMCHKRMTKNVLNEYSYRCSTCLVSYKLHGIGDQIKPCEIQLTFEAFRLLITESGRKFIFEFNDGKRQVFETPLEEYSNYQSAVISKIGISEEKDIRFSGLSQAITVHKFIESLELVDEYRK